MNKTENNVGVFDRERAEDFKKNALFLVTPYKTARDCISIADTLIQHFETHPQAKELPHRFFFLNINTIDLAYWETYNRIFDIPKDHIKIADPVFVHGNRIVEVTW